MKKLLLLLIPFLFIGCASIGISENTSTTEKSTIYSKYDKYNGATFYKNKKTKILDPIQLYIGQKDSNKFLRCYISYSGREWLFFDRIYLVNDSENRYTSDVRFYKKNTDVKDGRVYESIDFVINDEDIETLKQVLNESDVSLRLSGKRYRDYSLSKRNITAMREIIEFYESL